MQEKIRAFENGMDDAHDSLDDILRQIRSNVIKIRNGRHGVLFYKKCDHKSEEYNDYYLNGYCRIVVMVLYRNGFRFEAKTGHYLDSLTEGDKTECYYEHSYVEIYWR